MKVVLSMMTVLRHKVKRMKQETSLLNLRLVIILISGVGGTMTTNTCDVMITTLAFQAGGSGFNPLLDFYSSLKIIEENSATFTLTSVNG